MKIHKPSAQLHSIGIELHLLQSSYAVVDQVRFTRTNRAHSRRRHDMVARSSGRSRTIRHLVLLSSDDVLHYDCASHTPGANSVPFVISLFCAHAHSSTLFFFFFF